MPIKLIRIEQFQFPYIIISLKLKSITRYPVTREFPICAKLVVIKKNIRRLQSNFIFIPISYKTLIHTSHIAPQKKGKKTLPTPLYRGIFHHSQIVGIHITYIYPDSPTLTTGLIVISFFMFIEGLV